VAHERIWVSKDGSGKTLYVELSVYRNGSGLTISCPEDEEFKFYANQAGLKKFANKLERLFRERVEHLPPKPVQQQQD